MKLKMGLMVVPALLLGMCVVALQPGCDTGSPNDTGTVANGDFSGNYVGASNGLLVANNTGAPVSSINLNQSGSDLQAVDNNGILFKGTIGDILTLNGGSSNASSGSASATFTLTGGTTAGNSVTITGKLSGVGATATMTGLWVEPGVYSSIYGVAGITPIVVTSPSTNNNTTALSISPTSATLNTTSETVTFKASGGTSPYGWTVANTNGRLITAFSGPSVVYARNMAGNNTVVLSDSAGNTVTASIIQP